MFERPNFDQKSLLLVSTSLKIFLGLYVWVYMFERPNFDHMKSSKLQAFGADKTRD